MEGAPWWEKEGLRQRVRGEVVMRRKLLRVWSVSKSMLVADA